MIFRKTVPQSKSRSKVQLYMYNSDLYQKDVVTAQRQALKEIKHYIYVYNKNFNK